MCACVCARENIRILVCRCVINRFKRIIYTHSHKSEFPARNLRKAPTNKSTQTNDFSVWLCAISMSTFNEPILKIENSNNKVTVMMIVAAGIFQPSTLGTPISFLRYVSMLVVLQIALISLFFLSLPLVRSFIPLAFYCCLCCSWAESAFHWNRLRFFFFFFEFLLYSKSLKLLLNISRLWSNAQTNCVNKFLSNTRKIKINRRTNNNGERNERNENARLGWCFIWFGFLATLRSSFRSSFSKIQL